MTGRVFTKLLFSSLLLLIIGTAILDLTLGGIVRNSLLDQAEQSLAGKAALVAERLQRSAALDPQRFVRSESQAAQADVTLFDGRGHLLATSDPHRMPYGRVDFHRLGAGPAARVLNRQGDSLYLTIPAHGYFLQLRQNLNSVNSTMHLLSRDLLVASLLALLLAMLIAIYMARQAARRMRRILAFANQIAAGDLSARMNEDDLDEISSVTQALDTTASRLEESFRALEAKQRELAALLDSMQEAVIAVDAHGLVSWSNTVMQRIVPGGIREGRSLVQTIRDPDVLACVQGALQHREIRSVKAGSVLPDHVFEVNAAPTPDGGAVAVLHDVTGIERAEIMRRDFVANVSHELRTPLTSISGYVETLLDTTPDLPSHVQEFLGIILKNANRMNRLTEDLLALANVESGAYRLHRQPVSACRLLQDTVEGLAGMLLDSGITLEQRETTDTMVLVDIDAITQVFGNLIENAMKYGRSGQRVSVGARDHDGYVEFYVQDYGPGIAHEHQARIFERFYRVDKARSRDSGGTGLGLSIARHIVLAHEGTIHVESELGSGATFVVRLPAQT